jgi:VanZ family protein
MMRDLFRFRPEALKPLNVISIILIGMVFGIFTETLQRFFIPGRSGNVLDLAADAAGIIAGWLFFQMVFKKEIRGIKKKLYLRNP